MKKKGFTHAHTARDLRETARQVEGWEAGESGLDEAELKARIESVDAEGAMPEPLAAALGALSSGLRAGYGTLHGGGQEPGAEEAGEGEGA